MSKTKNILALILVTYCVSNDISRIAIQFKRLRLRWIYANSTDKAVNSHVSDGLKRLRISKLLLLAPSNNACNVLEERLQR